MKGLLFRRPFVSLGACRTYGNRSAKGFAGKPRSGCSQNSAGRGQILPVLQGNSHSIAQKSGKIWTGQTDLQPIHRKSDRLLDHAAIILAVSGAIPA